MQKVGFEKEELIVICGLLLEAKEKLMSREAESIRQRWRMKGDSLIYEKT